MEGAARERASHNIYQTYARYNINTAAYTARVYVAPVNTRVQFGVNNSAQMFWPGLRAAVSSCRCCVCQASEGNLAVWSVGSTSLCLFLMVGLIINVARLLLCTRIQNVFVGSHKTHLHDYLYSSQQGTFVNRSNIYCFKAGLL